MAILDGLCVCGCGQTTNLAPKTSIRRGHIKGQPVRFVHGHAGHRELYRHFWEKVDLSGGPEACWPWTARLNNNGYGQTGDRKTLVHRVSWELHFGPIPLGLCVCHDCPGGDRPECVNPAHLFLGTHKENIADMMAKGRQVRGEKKPNAKLTETQVLEIRRLSSSGISHTDLASRFGVRRGTIYPIIVGRTWKHLVVLEAG